MFSEFISFQHKTNYLPYPKKSHILNCILLLYVNKFRIFLFIFFVKLVSRDLTLLNSFSIWFTAVLPSQGLRFLIILFTFMSYACRVCALICQTNLNFLRGFSSSFIFFYIFYFFFYLKII